MTDFTFQTNCGHHGTIKPVRATGGPKEGHWMCKIKGPKVKGSSGIKTVYSPPCLSDAQEAVAKFLRTPASQVVCSSQSSSSLHIASSSPVVKSESAYSSSPSPSRQVRAGSDTLEPSPNNQAKCRQCGKPILKGEMRVGKMAFVPRYHRYSRFYYHERCVSASFKADLALPDPRIKEERARLLQNRKGLRERLRQLRLAFADRLDVAPYCIFNDTTLDDITVRLPQTKSQLMACNGIKEKRYQNFGTSILAITRLYKEENQMSGARSYASTPETNASQQSSLQSEDGFVQVAETLSCEEIVNQKFQHAEANGYVIEV